MDSHDTKALAGTMHVKSADRGDVEAIFATIGVTDHDKDHIRPNAISDGATVAMSGYGHNAIYGSRPVGKGVIRIEGNKALFRGRVFLNTSEGRETFEVLKEMGTEQQWSFGFSILGEEAPTDAERKSGARRALTKLDAFEVSPVLRGAGIGTRTVAVKHAAEDDTQAQLREMVTAHQRRTEWLEESIRARGGLPLLKVYPHLEGAIKYALDILRLTPPDIAPTYAVPPEAIPGASGQFSRKDFALYVSYGLDNEEATSVLFHEMVHMADHKWRGPCTEASAEAGEAILTKGWRERRDSIADYAQKEELRAIARRWTT